MTEGALSEAEMLLALRDIHLPSEAAGGAFADVAAAVSLAGLAALLLGGLLRGLSRRRRAPKAPRLSDILDRLRDQPDPVRRVELLRLLKTRAPDRFEALRDRLYTPTGGVETDDLEAEVRARA